MKKIIVVILICLIVPALIFLSQWHKKHIWQQAIIKELKTKLVDPESAQIDFLCYAEEYKISIHYTKSPHAACALVNAKNKMGGYTGQKLMAFHLTEGQQDSLNC